MFHLDAIRKLLQRHPVWPQPRHLSVGMFGAWAGNYEVLGNLADYGCALEVSETPLQAGPQHWQSQTVRSGQAALEAALDEGLELSKVAARLEFSGMRAALIALEGVREVELMNLGAVKRQLPRIPKEAGLGRLPVLITSITFVKRASILLMARGEKGAAAIAAARVAASASHEDVTVARVTVADASFTFGAHRAILLRAGIPFGANNQRSVDAGYSLEPVEVDPLPNWEEGEG